MSHAKNDLKTGFYNLACYPSQQVAVALDGKIRNYVSDAKEEILFFECLPYVGWISINALIQFNISYGYV